MLEIKMDKIINGAFQIVAIVLPHPCPRPYGTGGPLQRRGVLRRLKRRLVRKRERNLSDNYKCTQDMAKTSASERSLL